MDVTKQVGMIYDELKMKNDEWVDSLTGIESWFNYSVVMVVFVLIVVIVLLPLGQVVFLQQTESSISPLL